ncbi:SPARC-related modular calcium-binding protein 1 [Nymphon striatum]|nr:SPARC-related modular calcium-binding protein 1 [Nymphon striatum]
MLQIIQSSEYFNLFKNLISDSSFRQSEQEQLVRWKFTQIDTNVNRLLDRKEWKPFRRVMKEHKNLRKCGRKFLRFCDENTDRKITIQEWLDCFNLNEGLISRQEVGNKDIFGSKLEVDNSKQ